MAIQSGFYNSLNGDRIYDAGDMNLLFNQIISGGVFKDYSRSFFVSSFGTNGQLVSVAPGMAYCFGKWVLNDNSYVIQLDPVELKTASRIDAIVLNFDDNSRSVTIEVIKGKTSESPVKPDISFAGTNMKLLPLAYVTVTNDQYISNDRIENVVGTKECPYATIKLNSNGGESSKNVYISNSRPDTIKTGDLWLKEVE